MGSEFEYPLKVVTESEEFCSRKCQFGITFEKGPNRHNDNYCVLFRPVEKLETDDTGEHIIRCVRCKDLDRARIIFTTGIAR